MSIYSILIPKIDEISLVPNPVVQNSEFKISIMVSEIAVELKPETRYSGELYAGEV